VAFVSLSVLLRRVVLGCDLLEEERATKLARSFREGVLLQVLEDVRDWAELLVLFILSESSPL
jgi:hypothetical protein